MGVVRSVQDDGGRSAYDLEPGWRSDLPERLPQRVGVEPPSSPLPPANASTAANAHAAFCAWWAP